MMKGIINTVREYYLSAEKFQSEILRARNEFFNVETGGILFDVDPDYEPYFMEWLIFDFCLTSGLGLLEDYYNRNPKKLPRYKLQIYKNLQESIYGIMEVQKIDLGIGMEVIMLHTNKKYYVYEKSGTYQLKPRDLFFNRVAKIDDHWELVGANSLKLGMSLDKNLKQSFYEPSKIYTPKDALKLLMTESKEVMSIDEEFNLEENLVKIDKLFKEINIDKMVNARLVIDWLANIKFKHKSASTPIIDILYGLTDKDITLEQRDRLVGLIINLGNHSPQKKLGGKSPVELEKNRGDEPHHFDSALTRLGGEWPDSVVEANEFYKNGKINKTFEAYRKAFRTLLKEEVTGRYIFSVYANLAVTYLSCGEEYMARKLLGIALEINSDYEFGKNLLAKLNSEESTKGLAEGIRWNLKHVTRKKDKEFLKKSKEYSDKQLREEYIDLVKDDWDWSWQADPARKYYNFLKRLKINFKMEK